jgi:hypothetical protein
MLTSAWSGWSRGTWRRNRRFGAGYRKKIVRARRCLRSVPTDEADRDRDLISFCNVFHNLTVPRVLTYDVSAMRKRDQRIRQFHVLSSSDIRRVPRRSRAPCRCVLFRHYGGFPKRDDYSMAIHKTDIIARSLDHSGYKSTFHPVIASIQPGPAQRTRSFPKQAPGLESRFLTRTTKF